MAEPGFSWKESWLSIIKLSTHVSTTPSLILEHCSELPIRNIEEILLSVEGNLTLKRAALSVSGGYFFLQLQGGFLKFW